MRPERRSETTLAFLALALFLFGGWSSSARASDLGFVTDLISTSRPSTSSDHTIRFQLASPIPAGGRIVLAPQSGQFTVPDTLDFTDLDLATSSAFSGPYAQRTLAASAGAAADGVSVATGTSGSLTLTLNSSLGMAAGTFVRVDIGKTAVTGAAGDTQILNPSATGTYRMYFRTETAGGTEIDSGTAALAIVPAVDLSADTLDFSPPLRFNALPATTSIPAGIRFVEISLNTDEPATCRYATSSGTAFASMGNTFNVPPLSTFHNAVVSTPTDGTTYHFYVRCSDYVPNVNLDDFDLTFAVANPLAPPGPIAGGGGGGGGGGGSGGNPFPPAPGLPQITFSGRAYPGAVMTLLKDNVVFREFSADSSANFDLTIIDLPQGHYNFAIYARDSANRRSSSYTTTLTLIAGTRNVVAGILIPPTLALASASVGPGEAAEISGKSTPNATLEIWVSPQKKGVLAENEIAKHSAKADTRGDWKFSVPTSGLAVNTYEVKARAALTGFGTSNFSQPAYLGVGRAPVADTCVRSDLNGDTKVNLVDFSILLFNWNSTNPVADINLDGRVNLIDFSVMLFCWTG